MLLYEKIAQQYQIHQLEWRLDRQMTSHQLVRLKDGFEFVVHGGKVMNRPKRVLENHVGC